MPTLPIVLFCQYYVSIVLKKEKKGKF